MSLPGPHAATCWVAVPTQPTRTLGQARLRYNFPKPCACSQLKLSLSFSLIHPFVIPRMCPTQVFLSCFPDQDSSMTFSHPYKSVPCRFLGRFKTDGGHTLSLCFLCPNCPPFSSLSLCLTLFTPPFHLPSSFLSLSNTI